LAKHAYNNSVTLATCYSPIYTNYSFIPRSNWPINTKPKNHISSLYAYWIIGIHKNCLTMLETICESLGKYYDKGKKTPPEYKVGNLVMLNTKNLNFGRPVKKFEITMIGPFKIDKIVFLMAMQLVLLESWKIHLTFDVKLLELFEK
jgi:hypothetical protein